MNKELPDNQESAPVTKEQLKAAYKKFVDQGIEDPALLKDNPEAEEAERLLQQWMTAGDQAVSKGSFAEVYGHNLDKTTIMYDLGFRGHNYLVELYDWVGQDLAELEELSDEPDIVKLRVEANRYLQEIGELTGQ